MKSLTDRCLGCLLGLSLLAPLRAAETNDLVLQAMRDELARSTSQLQLANLDRPYFIAYRVQDSGSQGVAATFGSTLSRSEGRHRSFSVEVRVGSPALDNSHFQGGFGAGGGTRPLVSGEAPVDDNYTELRREIWLATDLAYKQAVENLAKKKAALQNKTRTDETPDFSLQKPVNITDLKPGKPIDLNQAEALVKELSAVFREAPSVATSQVRLSASDDLTRYVNSEGSAFVRQSFAVSLNAMAETQASDGSPLEDHFSLVSHRWEDLPSKGQLLASTRELGKHLAALRDATLLDQYNGPVLFEDQAAVEIFSQVFAPQLLARKRPVSEGRGGRGGLGAAQDNPFLDKLGARVLPDFLSVTEDPTLTKVGNTPLFRQTLVDDEAVPTRLVKLVEKGRLKTLLVSRSPVRGVPLSTGSMRGSALAPGNLIVSASEGLDAAGLKAELLKLLQPRGKDFAVIIRRLSNPALSTGRFMGGGRGGGRVEPVILAWKVFPDGKEELLRNVEIADLNTQSFKDILVAGSEPFVSTVPFRAPGSGGSSYVSFAVPSLLFEDVTLKKPAGEIPKAQVLKHPYFSQ